MPEFFSKLSLGVMLSVSSVQCWFFIDHCWFSILQCWFSSVQLWDLHCQLHINRLSKCSAPAPGNLALHEMTYLSIPETVKAICEKIN